MLFIVSLQFNVSIFLLNDSYFLYSRFSWKAILTKAAIFNLLLDNKLVSFYWRGGEHRKLGTGRYLIRRV